MEKYWPEPMSQCQKWIGRVCRCVYMSLPKLPMNGTLVMSSSQRLYGLTTKSGVQLKGVSVTGTCSSKLSCAACDELVKSWEGGNQATCKMVERKITKRGYKIKLLRIESDVL